MRIEITNIGEKSSESVEIKATVFWRGFPRPHYEENETDEQYEHRVRDIQKEITEYFNLHLGRATLTQEQDFTKIPKVAEYDC